MEATLDCPILELSDSFPEQLFVIRHPATGRYGCFCHQGVHGLAGFSSPQLALHFSEWIDLSGMSVEALTFDEAREVAKSRPLPVVALMLLDDLHNPKIHYVR